MTEFVNANYLYIYNKCETSIHSSNIEDLNIHFINKNNIFTIIYNII